MTGAYPRCQTNWFYIFTILQFVSNESVDKKESEVWRHGDDGEIGGPELLFVTLYRVVEEISELVLPIAVNIVENIPGEKHPNTQPATDKKHEVVSVLGTFLPCTVLVINHPPLSV